MKIIRFQGNEKFCTLLLEEDDKYYCLFGLVDNFELLYETTRQVVDNLIQVDGKRSYSLVTHFTTGKDNIVWYAMQLENKDSYRDITNFLEVIL